MHRRISRVELCNILGVSLDVHIVVCLSTVDGSTVSLNFKDNAALLVSTPSESTKRLVDFVEKIHAK